MYKTLSAPLSVQIEVTDTCNQLCSHCYRSCQQESGMGQALDPDQINHIIDELGKHEVFGVTFTGGEPLLYPSPVFSGVLRAQRYKMVTGLNTNLGFITPEIAEFLHDHNVRVLASLLSHRAEVHDLITQAPGSFDRFVRGTEILKLQNVALSINMVVRKENAFDVYDTGKFAHSLGAIRFSATKCAPSPGTNYQEYRAQPEQLINSLDSLLRLNQEFGIEVDILESYPLCFLQNLDKYAFFARRNCTAGIFNCSIGPDGTVRPCSHADQSYGNVLHESLRDCWLRMSEWRDGSLIPTRCQGCKYFHRCTGGCRFDAKYFTGNITDPDPLVMDTDRIIPVSLEGKTAVNLPATLRFSKHVQWRREEFGGIIKRNDEIAILSHQGMEVAIPLFDLHSFTISSLVTPSMSAEYLQEFFTTLFVKNLIEGGE